MKKILFLFALFLSVPVVAQETISLPSTFDENQMIVKRKDANGNFVPVNQIKIDLDNQPALKAEEKNLQGVKLKIKESVQNSEKKIPAQVNEQAEQKLPNENTLQPPTEQKRVRRLRAREKDYGMPKTTFGSSALQEAEMFSGVTFDTSTMEETVKEFKRESTFFEECDSDDPECKTYELDEEGQVIF